MMNRGLANNEIKSGYKKTKLGWIPEDWEINRFDDVFQFVKNYSFSRNDLTFNDNEGDTFYIHYGDIHTKFDFIILDLDKNNHHEVPLLKQSVKPENNLTYLKEGDLIIADASEDYDGVGVCIEIGKLSNSKKIIAGLHTIVARDKAGKTAYSFRTYILKNNSVSKELKKIATGISVFGISKGNLSKLQIPIPPLPEQKKIGEILSTWDRAIETLEQLIAQKEELKRGLMQQLLTGKTRFPGFEGEWENKSIKSFSKVITGSTPNTSEPKYYNGDYLFVSPSDMDKIKYVTATEKTLTREGFELGRIVPKGSTLFVAIGSTIGKTAVSGVDLITNQQIHAIVTDQQICLNEFFFYQLTRISDRIKLLAGKQAVPILNKSNFQSLRISFPSIQEQRKIVKLLAGMENEIEHLKNYQEEIEHQKKGLMQQLLTGETRVKVN